MKPFSAITLLICSICVLSCASSPKYSREAADQFSDQRSYALSSEVGRGFEGGANPDERMIARSVSMEIESDKPEETKEKISLEVKNFKGFIIQENTSQDSTSYISLRVPSQSLDAFCAQVRRTGNLVSERTRGEDITDSYRDDLIRLDSLKTVRARYTALLSKAGKVEEMLGIEKELERINGQIELYEGRKKHNENRVAYALVNIEIKTKVRPGPLGWVFYGLYKGIYWLFVWD